MFFLEVGRDALHNLLCLGLVIDLVGVDVLWCAELQLSDRALLALLDCDLFCGRKELLLSSHDLDELLQIFDFLWLYYS